MYVIRLALVVQVAEVGQIKAAMSQYENTICKRQTLKSVGRENTEIDSIKLILKICRKSSGISVYVVILTKKSKMISQ